MLKDRTEKIQIPAKPSRNMGGGGGSIRSSTKKQWLVLDYGVTARANVQQSNFKEVKQLQNQAISITTGATRTTQIQQLEEITALKPTEGTVEDKNKHKGWWGTEGNGSEEATEMDNFCWGNLKQWWEKIQHMLKVSPDKQEQPDRWAS